MTLGWDIMQQIAKALELEPPFQVVIYAQTSSKIQDPMQVLQLDAKESEVTLCYVVQMLQVPTAQLFQDLMIAI